MEVVIFCGIQASGKSTFFQERYRNTHVRINLDMLRSRHRESILVQACFAAQQPFVVDNTNPDERSRARYIHLAKFYNYRVIGFCFVSDIESCLRRNASRPPIPVLEEPQWKWSQGMVSPGIRWVPGMMVPEAGVRATYARFTPPRMSEGFDELHRVAIKGDSFSVEAMIGSD
jgi:hypothetical protein